MRLLHTSDWHIGRSLHGTDLLAEQETVLSGLASVVAAESVDAVLVAGDVYDRAVPSADATAVLDRVIGRLLAAGAAVIMTPGNHDSARRLGTFSGLLSAAGLHVRADTGRLDEPVLLADEHGDVAVYGLPFLEPEVARHELGVTGGRSHEAVLGAAMERVRVRPVPPAGHAVGRARPRLRRGRRAQRERAGHLRRRGRPRPGLGVRRRRLRGPGSPPPAADPLPAAALQRLPAGLLLRRGGAAEAGLAGRARRLRPGRRAARPAADPAPAHRAHRHARRAARRPRARRCRGRASSPPGSPTPPVPTDPMRRLQTRFPHCVHLEWRGTASGGRRPELPGADARAQRRRDRRRSSSQHVRGVAASAAERELLARALGAADRAEAAR